MQEVGKKGGGGGEERLWGPGEGRRGLREREGGWKHRGREVGLPKGVQHVDVWRGGGGGEDRYPR